MNRRPSALLMIFVALVILVGGALALSMMKRANLEAERQRAATAHVESQQRAVKEEQSRALAERQEAQRRRSEIERTTQAVAALYTRWKDARSLAGSTARIALTGPVGSLQAIRREAEAVVVPPCLDKPRGDLLAGMDTVIQGFMYFMQDPKLGPVMAETMFATAGMQFEQYETGAKGCAQ